MLCAVFNACCLLLAPQASAEELRDPFTFAPRASDQPAPHLTLIGVLWDTAHPLAVVGETIVGIGDTVAGWRVVDITQEGITLQHAEQRLFLKPGDPLPVG